MATISGILIDGAGQALPNVQIVLTALKTSSKVLNQTKTIIITTSETGAYSINAQVGQYAVTVFRNGFPVERVGIIQVYVNSSNGSLNDFLLNPSESELSPEILAQIVEQRQLAQQAATNAQTSANNVSNTLANAVLKTGSTMTGDLSISKSRPLFSMLNTSNQIQMDYINGAEVYVLRRTDVSTGNYRDIFSYNYANDIFTFSSAVSLNIGGVAVTGSSGNLYAAGTQLLKVGVGGLYHENLKNIGISDETTTRSGFIGKTSSDYSTSSLKSLGAFACAGINLTYATTSGDTYISRLLFQANQPKMYLSQYRSGAWQAPVELKTSANTTVDSNGFLKSASPILRLYAEEPEAVEGFTQAGYALVNSEAQSVYAKKIDVGHYEIYGSLGFAKEGWYVEQPKDANGNVFSFVEYSTDENNVITVKTFKKKFDFETCNIVSSGEPVDIKEDRWINLRLEMPVVDIDEPILPIASTLNPVIID